MGMAIFDTRTPGERRADYLRLLKALRRTMHAIRWQNFLNILKVYEPKCKESILGYSQFGQRHMEGAHG